jgi:hypothetical protein
MPKNPFVTDTVKLIGAPKGFDLLAELTQATQISIAMAFAHQSGWNLLRQSVKSSGTDVRLVAGASFFQTEPAVLRDWAELFSSDARLYTGNSCTFHPKVIVVDGVRPFAIVGSSNLSRGGLMSNVECCVYVKLTSSLKELASWFDDVHGAAIPVSIALGDYEAKWKANRKSTRALENKQKEAEGELSANLEVGLRDWDQAVRDAKAYQRTPKFKDKYALRAEAARRIRQYLGAPEFRITRSDWKLFFRIEELGHLIPIRRDGIHEQWNTVRPGLRQLMAKSTERSIDDLISDGGKYKVSGMGINLVSKILAVHAPTKWAVLNEPVKAALQGYGYTSPRGLSKAQRYMEFNRLMQRFKRETGLQDAFAVDCFFFHRSETHRRSS